MRVFLSPSLSPTVTLTTQLYYAVNPQTVNDLLEEAYLIVLLSKGHESNTELSILVKHGPYGVNIACKRLSTGNVSVDLLYLGVRLRIDVKPL